jgi:aminoglycoside phosphotransferase (APT) family kinase protein
MTGTDPGDVWRLIAQRIAPGSTVRRAWPLAGGISAHMTALLIAESRGESRTVIVRRPSATTLARNPRAAASEFRLLRLTQALGLATPAALDLDESGAILPAPYLAIDYVAGAPEFAHDAAARIATEAAEHLALIHRADLTTHDVSFLPRRSPVCPEIARAGTAVDPAWQVDRIRAALAAIGPAPQRTVTALLHGDYWPGNLLWRDGRLVAVIDWEDAAVGDPLIDLAIARLDLLWIFGRDAMDAFTARYRSLQPVDRAALPYRDLCAALRMARLAGTDLAAWTAFFQPYGRHDITAQSFRAHARWFVERAIDRLAAP